MNNTRILNLTRYFLLLTLLALLFGSSSCDPVKNPRPIVIVYYQQVVNFRTYAEWSPIRPGNNGIYQAPGVGMWMMYDITRIDNTSNTMPFTFKLKNVYAQVGTDRSTFVDMKKLDTQQSIQDLFFQEDYFDTIPAGKTRLSKDLSYYVPTKLGDAIPHLRFVLLMPSVPRSEQAETTNLLYDNENSSVYGVEMQREPLTTDVRYEDKLAWDTMVYDVFKGQWFVLNVNPEPQSGSDFKAGPTLINGSGGSHGNSNNAGVIPWPHPNP
jgi:hypothetical protein